MANSPRSLCAAARESPPHPGWRDPTGEGDVALCPGRSRPVSAGFSLVEVVISMALMTFASLGVVGSMLAGAQVDEDLRVRSIALRAAVSRIERIQSFDDGGDIRLRINYATDAAQASFEVEGLARPSAAAVGAVGPAAPPHGVILVDATDPDRIAFSVRVAWTSREGHDRRITLPVTLTEVTP